MNQWDSLLSRVATDGWNGVEVAFPLVNFSPSTWIQLCEKHELSFVVQIHTCGYRPHPSHLNDPLNNRGFVPSTDVGDHVDDFKLMVTKAKQWGAIFVNSHSGSDVFSDTEAEDFIRQALDIEEEVGIPVSHETHRRRLFWNPYQTNRLLPKFPTLKITADLSHWVVVCERTFDEHSDPVFWPAMLDLLGKHIYHIHGRVGFNEGPQVPDPRSSEFQFELTSHETWWDALLHAQLNRGVKNLYFEPEFGPSPYLHLTPHTSKPVADIWEVNHWMAVRAARRFEKQVHGYCCKMYPLTGLNSSVNSSNSTSQPITARASTPSQVSQQAQKEGVGASSRAHPTTHAAAAVACLLAAAVGYFLGRRR